MSQQVFPANPRFEIILLVLQVFQVPFLWFHDWIPLGRLNDVTAVRSQGTSLRLIAVTLIQSVPLLTVEPSGTFLYVTNADQGVFMFAIDPVTGALTATTPATIPPIEPNAQLKPEAVCAPLVCQLLFALS